MERTDSVSPVSAAGLASAAVPGAVQDDGQPVNGYRLLEQVVALPVSTWRYHWDPPHVRHLGPMAQDWWQAFGVGENDRTICCTDTNGVALVAIQALHRLLTDTQQALAAVQEEVDRLKASAGVVDHCAGPGLTRASSGDVRPGNDLA